MIQELLVLIACTQNSGCSDTTTAYFNANPKARQTVSEQKDKANKVIPPSIISLSPAVLFLVKQRGSFYITKSTSLQLEVDRLFVVFKKSF